MSRKVINILFIVGSCLYIPGIAMIIWAYVGLFHNISQSAYYGPASSSSFDGLGTFGGFLWGRCHNDRHRQYYLAGGAYRCVD